MNANLTTDVLNVIQNIVYLFVSGGLLSRPRNRIDNSSQNGNNNNSPTLNMTDSVNAESVDNSENSHNMLSINKGGNVLLQTAQGIIINGTLMLKKNILKISHLKTFYFLTYVHVRYVKRLFTNIPKHAQITREFSGLRMRNFQGIVFI